MSYIGISEKARKIMGGYIGIDGVARKISKAYVGVNGVAMLAWSGETPKPIILEVEKITSNTYAGETTYTDESFILLDIYPKTNGTVNITYGGLTKTITDTSGAEEPNAQEVFFGTFNGISDSVATPTSGTLTIEGDYYAFGCVEFSTGKIATGFYWNIKEIIEWGKVICIPPQAFGNILNAEEYCPAIKNVITLPNGLQSIGAYAFINCKELTSVVIPNSVKSIGDMAFSKCIGITSIRIPKNVTNIDQNIFAYGCDNNPITVDSDNPFYKIDGNCLIEIESNKLISGFLNSIIPNYVNTIDKYAFAGVKLKSITIPNSVISINGSAFRLCEELTSVVIPNSVKSIGYQVFYGCENLTSVVFEDVSNWYVSSHEDLTDAISVDVSDSANNATLLKDTYCSYYWYRLE